METFSALLALCVGNSLVTGEFPSQRPVTWSFDVFFDLCLNKWLSNQSWGWWFETPSCPLWCHHNELDIRWCDALFLRTCQNRPRTRPEWALFCHNCSTFTEISLEDKVMIFRNTIEIIQFKQQCVAVIIWSIFTNTFTIDIPLLTCEGKICGVFCEYKLWFMFCFSHCNAVCNIISYWHPTHPQISWHPMQHCNDNYSIMTSSYGNIFHVTGPLCREFTSHRWIPLTKASDTDLWCFLWSAPE